MSFVSVYDILTIYEAVSMIHERKYSSFSGTTALFIANLQRDAAFGCRQGQHGRSQKHTSITIISCRASVTNRKMLMYLDVQFKGFARCHATNGSPHPAIKGDLSHSHNVVTATCYIDNIFALICCIPMVVSGERSTKRQGNTVPESSTKNIFPFFLEKLYAPEFSSTPSPSSAAYQGRIYSAQLYKLSPLLG